MTYLYTRRGSSPQFLARHQPAAAYEEPSEMFGDTDQKLVQACELTVISILPSGLPPAVTSKKTTGFDMFQLVEADWA